MQKVISIDSANQVELSKFYKLDYLSPLQKKLALFVGEAAALASVENDLPYEVTMEIAEIALKAEHLLEREIERKVYLQSKSQIEASCKITKALADFDEFLVACGNAGKKSNHFKVEK